MWRVGSLMMMRRAGLSCCGKEVRMLFLSDVVVTVLSCRSKMARYAAKESNLCCLLHTSANVETGDGGRGSLGRLATANVRSLMGLWGGGCLVWGASVNGTCTVPTCSHVIDSSSSSAEACMGGCRVGIVSSCLDAARACRLSMSFRISYV